MATPLDIKGCRFGKLTVISLIPEDEFNNIYMTWKERNNEKDTTFYDWYKPSLDHIVPKSRGGDNSLDNLQYLTVFENLSKRDMTMIEWEEFKQKTNTKSELFL